MMDIYLDVHKFSNALNLAILGFFAKVKPAKCMASIHKFKKIAKFTVLQNC